MNSTPDMPQKIHEGRNVKRFREMLGLKQNALAYELGEDWSQKKVSQLEQKETIELEVLELVSKILKIPMDAIRNFSEEKAINIISSTFNDSAAAVHNYFLTFNPIDKLMK